MNNNNNNYQKEKITTNFIPLAIYREIAAHLRQIQGVEVTLIPQTSTKFNYNYSQISGLEISYPSNLEDYEKKSLNSILEYYSQRWTPFMREIES